MTDTPSTNHRRDTPLHFTPINGSDNFVARKNNEEFRKQLLDHIRREQIAKGPQDDQTKRSTSTDSIHELCPTSPKSLSRQSDNITESLTRVGTYSSTRRVRSQVSPATVKFSIPKTSALARYKKQWASPRSVQTNTSTEGGAASTSTPTSAHSHVEETGSHTTSTLGEEHYQDKRSTGPTIEGQRRKKQALHQDSMELSDLALLLSTHLKNSKD